MARKGRRPLLDEARKKEIVAILSVGCPRSTAARYVGCSPNTLLNTAQREPEFFEQMRHAEMRAEIEYMRYIQEAAHDPRYWRAAAWVLERRNPTEYRPRPVELFTHDQVEQLVRQLAALMLQTLPDAPRRQALVKQVNHVMMELLGPETPRLGGEEDESLDAR